MGTVPELTYLSIKLCGKDWTSGSRASFQPNFNRLVFTYTTSPSLSYIEVRVTGPNQDWDIGQGILADWDANVSASQSHVLTVDINSNTFQYGDGVYRISIYGKSSIDGTWTETQFFLTVYGQEFLTADSGNPNLDVIRKDDIPEHSD